METARRRGRRRGGVTRRGVAGWGAALGGALTLGALGAACGAPAAPAAVPGDVRADLTWYLWSSNTNVRGEAYNADLLAREGIKPPDGGWDWKQLLELSQRLTVRKDDAPQRGLHVPPAARRSSPGSG